MRDLATVIRDRDDRQFLLSTDSAKRIDHPHILHPSIEGETGFFYVCFI